MLKKYFATCLLALTTISASQVIPSWANAQNLDSSSQSQISQSNQPAKATLVNTIQVNQRSVRRSVILGMASWYGGEFHGKLSASGEVFNKYELTAAHPSLPFGTAVRVTNANNGKSVVVRINDRGPFHGGRVLDVSKAAASALGFLGDGVAPVRVEVLSSPRQGV